MGLLGRLLATCSQAVRLQCRLACHLSTEICQPSCSNRGVSTMASHARKSLAAQARNAVLLSSGANELLQRNTLTIIPSGFRALLQQLQPFQQTRSLFAAKPKHKKPPKNWQKHDPKPRDVGRKMKTPSVAKRRFYVAEDGTIMRRHTHNRHNKSKRSKSALRRLKGDAPLAKGYAKKLRKLGFKRTFWYHRRLL